MSEVVELFGGPGGWGIALDALGHDAVAVEWDHDACATRVANGLRSVIRADVAAYPPNRFSRAIGLVASPPCPQFSNAGAGHGRRLMAELRAAITDVWHGADPAALAEHVDAMAELIYDHLVESATWPLADAVRLADSAVDAASEAALMAEPARWIRELPNLEWVAMEQVPAAAPLYQRYAELLIASGWRSAWVGRLHAEQFGVPQTRTRVLLLAARDRVVHPPEPTHQKYEPGVAAGSAGACSPSLFGPGLLPWVSMAEALGLADGDAVGFPRLDDTGTSVDGYRERDTGQNSRTAGGGSEIFERTTEALAPTVTGQARSWSLIDRQEHGAERRGDEPAPTILASHDNGNKRWVLNTRRGQRTDGSTQTRDDELPAPTVTAKAGDGQWVWERPATTVMGDPSLWPPGHKINRDDLAAGRAGGMRSRGDTVRLSIEQAAVLQSFPLEYRFVGTKTSAFQQVGNAVPPLLALHAIAAVTGADVP